MPQPEPDMQENSYDQDDKAAAIANAVLEYDETNSLS